MDHIRLDPLTDNILYDAPQLLEPRLREWDSTIHAALQDIFSTTGLTEYKIVQNKHEKGYKALFDIICPNHPEHDTYPSLLIKDRPIQREWQSITDYFNKYVNYLKLSAYLTDVSINLNHNRERETFIGNLQQGCKFLDKTYNERHSNNPTKRAMYLQGNLVGMLESVTKQICPSCHFSGSSGSPIPKKELTFNCSQQICKKPLALPTKGIATKKVQVVDVFNANNSTNVMIPEEFGSAFDHIADKYVNTIASTASFDTLRPCAVCDKAGHTFDDCPVLQNVEFLQKHYIQFKLFLKKQSATTATINQVQVTEDADYDHINDSYNEYPITEDFHQGQE